MIIGAQKCGTTTLAEILSSHPDICFSQVKEPHFFSKSQDWQEDIKSYKDLYSPKSTQICGEASTTYTCYPEFNKNIWQSLYSFNAKLKLIYIMRDPVSRIVSHYMHNYVRGYTSEPIEEAVLSDPTYINRTRYFIQVKPYIDIFGRGQVLLLTLEEFIENKKNTLAKIANFLDINFDFSDSSISVHKNDTIKETKSTIGVEDFARSKMINNLKPFVPNALRKSIYSTLQTLTQRKIHSKPSISVELNEAIVNLLALDILEVEKLIGRDLVEWTLTN